MEEVEKGTGLSENQAWAYRVSRGEKAQNSGGRVAGKGRREKGLLEAGEKQELRSCVYLTLSEHFANKYLGFIINGISPFRTVAAQGKPVQS